MKWVLELCAESFRRIFFYMKGSGGLSEIIVSSLEVGACASTYVDVCVCVPANLEHGLTAGAGA